MKDQVENIEWLDERSSGEYLNISKFPDISCRKGNIPAYEDMKLGKYRNKVKIFTMRNISTNIFHHLESGRFF